MKKKKKLQEILWMQFIASDLQSRSDDLGSDGDDLNQSNEKNVIVFESQLNKLFLFCQQCGSIVIEKQNLLKEA